MENPLKSYDFSGFPGPSDWFRTSGLVVPNRSRKLFPDVSNGFLSFPLVFRGPVKIYAQIYLQAPAE